MTAEPKLYNELAEWWPLFSAPEEYGEEAAWISDAFRRSLGHVPVTVLELGSGGGNTASHLARDSNMTLVDLYEPMLDVSRRLNPHAEHAQGDMRTVRLGKTFEGVLIHDAIMYMTTIEDLVASLTTARAHLAAGGVLIVLPDHVSETVEESVSTGGHDASDGSGRGVRYLEWTHAPAEAATTYQVDFAIVTRDADGSTHAFHDTHTEGIFPRSAWRDAFARAGFAPPEVRVDPWGREVFNARADAVR
jgi:SAM-dependent methyltransferase